MLDVGGEGVFVTGPNNTGLSFINVGYSSGVRATDINASGQVVGNGHIDSSTYLHAFMTDKSHSFVSDLGTLGGSTSSASAVNDSGQVVGASQAGLFGPNHAFITTMNSNMTDLGTLGGPDSYAWDINSDGQVVGWSTTGTGNAHHAFVTGADGLGMVDLNSMVTLSNGTFLAEARAINDLGQILANGSDGRAYLLSPIPEPQTHAMLLAGLGLMGFMARKRRAA
jgi:probable HAF family extracellular repeat protein